MNKFIIVFIAGGAGCLARYVISLLLPKPQPAFPWHTLAANLAACLVIALGAYLLRDRLNSTGLFAVTAFCGGLSTFSAFSLETIELFNRGMVSTAFVYVFTTLIFCFLTIFGLSRMV